MITSTTMKVFLENLDKIFGPKTSVIASRYRFRRRAHRIGEPIQEFVRDLRELAETCAFKIFTDEMIRDHIIEKISNPRIRERLLMEPDSLTLEKTIEVAIQIETATAEAKTITKGTFDASAQDIQAIGESKRRYNHNKIHDSKTSKRKCNRCGSEYNKEHKCPAIGKTCSKCRKQNHFAAVCKSKSVRIVNNSSNEQEKPVILNIGPRTPHTLDVKIGNYNIPFIIDSGSSVSILSSSEYRRVRNQVGNPRPSDEQLTAFGGSRIKTHGYIMTSVLINNKTSTIKLYVADGNNNLIGRDDFHNLGICVKVNNIQYNSFRSKLDVQEEFPSLFNGIGKAKGFVHKKNSTYIERRGRD